MVGAPFVASSPVEPLDIGVLLRLPKLDVFELAPQAAAHCKMPNLDARGCYRIEWLRAYLARR